MTIGIPVSVICGFLGAGKTTLLNQMLRAPGGERLGVLVNDFGALNIDADLIAAKSGNKIALTNGCVCCSIQDDLAASAIELVRSNHGLSRIVVECSGLSHPAGVLAVFDGPFVSSLATVDIVLNVVDASAFPDLDFHSTELAIEQAALSDIVVLNKVDLVDRVTTQNVISILRGAQPHMTIVPATRGRLPMSVLLPADLATRSARPNTAASGQYVDHEREYRTVCVTWDRPLDLGNFKQLNQSLPPGILRAKGILNLGQSGGKSIRGDFQRVGKRSSLELEESRVFRGSRVVMIGRNNDLPEDVVRAAVAAHCPGFELITSAPRALRRKRLFGSLTETSFFDQASQVADPGEDRRV